jgi:Uma2 family endonuclease
MSTKKKTETSHLSPKKQFQYEFAEAKPTLVEEPFMPLPEIKLDMTQRYTFEEYLTWIDDVGRELINGFIHVLSAPLRIHARISFELSYLFRMLTIKRKGKCQIYHAPFNVRLSLNNDTDADKIVNVVQPDICVVCDPAKLDKYGCMGSPDLVVEVLSPSTLKKDWNY